jgi:hypothetical protein
MSPDSEPGPGTRPTDTTQLDGAISCPLRGYRGAVALADHYQRVARHRKRVLLLLPSGPVRIWRQRDFQHRPFGGSTQSREAANLGAVDFLIGFLQLVFILSPP